MIPQEPELPQEEERPEVLAQDEPGLEEARLGVLLRPAFPEELVPEDEDDLAPLEPLQQYMKEVRRYPLLSREEEHELAVRYREHGDQEAAARLVTANLRLVVKIAYGYRRAYRNLLDLIQEGNMGLLQAVKRYDPYRGVRLTSYASWWIRAYMLKYLLDNFRLIRVGTTRAQRKLFYSLSREQQRLRSLGFDPTPQLLAERLDVTEQDVQEMQQRMSASELSLDRPLEPGESEGPRYLELIPNHAPAPEARVARAQIQGLLKEALAEFAETLDPRERTIFEKRLLAEEPVTLRELGEEFGVTRERARQLESRILEKARAFLRRRRAQEFEHAAREEP